MFFADSISIYLKGYCRKICEYPEIMFPLKLDTECVIYPWAGNHHISGIIQTDNIIISILSLDKLFSFFKS